MTEPNPPRPDLVYPEGAPEDTNGPARPEPEPAQRDSDGRWLDPDSGEVAAYPVDEPSAGVIWTARDLRQKRAAWEASGPPAPVQPPPPTELERIEQAEAAELEAVRLQHQPPGNLDDSDRPHFLRTANGVEVCGQDGEPWPCETWTRWMQERDAPAGEVATITTTEAAQRLGVDPQELAAFLANRNRS